MNRRYCYCKESKADTSLVPKCLLCGYYISDQPRYDNAYYKRQIKGLILIIQDADNKDIMVTREYIIEKLTMILEGGIGFHQIINRHLDKIEGKGTKCGCCKGTGKIYSELIKENVNCGGCGGSGVDDD